MKTDLLVSQTRLRVPAFSAGSINIQPIEKGGSDRRFYRVRCSDQQSLILVKYSREREENRHYVTVAKFLRDHGVRAPKIYFHDSEEGLIWIEDLGETDLFSFRGTPGREQEQSYRSAVAEIAKLHAIEEPAWDGLAMPAEFNPALYRWEQSYFFENCLGRVFGLGENEIRKLECLPALEAIAQHLASGPRVLVHRDFQSQNVVVRNGEAYLIDFQGMRPGAAEYDMASLLYDPYVQLSAEERDDLFSFYLEERGLPPDSAAHRETLRLCGMQRLMQALGAYGFLGLVKNNRAFLAHIPAALGSLREILGGIRGTEPLGAAIAYLPGNVLSG